MNEEAGLVQHKCTHGSSGVMIEGTSLALTLLSHAWHLSSLAHFPSDVLLHHLLSSLLHPGGWGEEERSYVSPEVCPSLTASHFYSLIWPFCVNDPHLLPWSHLPRPLLISALNRISLQALSTPWKCLICYLLLCHHPGPVPQNRSDLMTCQ